MTTSMDVLEKVNCAFSSIGGCSFNLKPKQLMVMESLIAGRDVIAILPTGYGKSMTFQVLSRLLTRRSRIGENITIIIAPLNSIIKDQIATMKSKGIRAEVLNRRTSRIPSLFAENDENEFDSDTKLKWPDYIVKGKLELLLAHPETLLNSSTLDLFRGDVYRNRVCALVVDEAHLIHTW